MADLFIATCSGANGKAGAERRKGTIDLWGIDPVAKEFRHLATSTEVPSPSFMCWSPHASRLFVASEIARGDGRVTALDIKGDRMAVVGQAGTGGNAAVHLSLDRRGQHLFVANYQADTDSGSISVAAFELIDQGGIGAMTGNASHKGSGPDKNRQSRPHCHCVAISPDNRQLAAIDLGTDSVYLYGFEAPTGSISLSRRIALAPGCGPRHGVFHPTLPLFYLCGELDSTIVTIDLDTSRTDTAIVGRIPATRADMAGRNYPSGVAISPDGHYLLVGNRGADTIAVFWIDPRTGMAQRRSETRCGGAFPRAIRFDASARLLAVANQKSGNVAIFGWDFATGALTQEPLLSIEIPTALDAAFPTDQ